MYLRYLDPRAAQSAKLALIHPYGARIFGAVRKGMSVFRLAFTSSRLASAAAFVCAVGVTHLMTRAGIEVWLAKR